ncbi:MAG TPA: peptidase M48 [Bacteroidetes bacterium]|nr:peptidase M48 [Bacteroidota bacterium]HRR07737.1 M48 family metallopeptidase [Rhodothermales bacterium]
MNAIGWFILVAVLIAHVIDTLAEWLNMRAADTVLPPALVHLYDEEAYEKAQTYLKSNTRFGMFKRVLDLVALLLFWFLGGFGWLDVVARSFGWGEIATGLLFVGGLVLLNGVMGLPFGWYHTFVIEERFGFNKTTPKTFWMDRIKALVLGLLIGVPVLVLVLWLLGKMGESAWLYVWGAITLISLALQYIAPTWIMPFFNTFKPLQANDPLRQAVLSYAHNVSFPLTNILVMDGSRRSSKANAFFTGFGKNRRIALFDTLIADHTIPELTAIVAHEVGHYKHRHLLKGMITGILQTGAYLFVLSLCIKLPGLYAAFGLEQQSVYAGLVFFGLLFSPIEFLLGMLSNYFSRKHEFEADAYALETAPEPEALGEALKKMSVKHLTNLNPHPLFVFLNHSHPPLLQRLAAMERILLVKP